MKIKEELEKLISLSAVIVKNINDAEKEVKDLEKKKGAYENEIKSMRESNLDSIKSLQSEKNALKEYESKTKSYLENEKSKVEALVKETEGKLKLAEEKLKESERRLSDASIVKNEAEKLKLIYEEKVRKFKEALSQ